MGVCACVWLCVCVCAPLWQYFGRSNMARVIRYHCAIDSRTFERLIAWRPCQSQLQPKQQLQPNNTTPAATATATATAVVTSTCHHWPVGAGPIAFWGLNICPELVILFSICPSDSWPTDLTDCCVLVATAAASSSHVATALVTLNELAAQLPLVFNCVFKHVFNVFSSRFSLHFSWEICCWFSK